MTKSGFTITKRDRAIARYIWEKKLCKRITDDAIWIDIAKVSSMPEQWKELKHRFIKYVIPNLKGQKFIDISAAMTNSFTLQLCNQLRTTQKNKQASTSSVCFDSCYESHNPVSPESDNDTNVSLDVQGRSSRNSERSKSNFTNNNNLELETDNNFKTNTTTLMKRTILTTSDNKIQNSNPKAHSASKPEVREQDERSPSQLYNKRNDILIVERKTAVKTEVETAENNSTDAEEQKIHVWPCCNCLELNELCPVGRNHIFKRRCVDCNTKQIIEIGRGVVIKVELYSNITTRVRPVDTIETIRKMLLPDVSHYEYFF